MTEFFLDKFLTQHYRYQNNKTKFHSYGYYHRVWCELCIQSFSTKEELEKHKSICKVKTPQIEIMPSKGYP